MMEKDIIERLRKRAYLEDEPFLEALLCEAADEIEELKTDYEMALKTIDRFQYRGGA